MYSNYGQHVQVNLFGESHGSAVGCVINGLAPGIALDLEFITRQLELRRPHGNISTSRRESDDFEIISGFYRGYTTGTPLCIIIPNREQRSEDYEKKLVRPSHADYTAQEKYMGFQDHRGGGHFSGRITAPLVAAGAVFMQVLRAKGVNIGTHIASCLEHYDDSFSKHESEIYSQVEKLNISEFPVLSPQAEANLRKVIEQAHAAGDSVGGILETIVLGMPTGIGEPFFHSIESVLSHLIFSVPAIKGVEFGLGFAFAGQTGCQVNDAITMREGRVVTTTNNNGGINGGISNGMPIIIRSVVKPTPSIHVTQQTIDLESGENAEITIAGRHDPAIMHRARVVIDSVVALGLLDLFAGRYGYMWMTK